MSKPKFTPGPWSLSDTSIVTDKHCIAVIEDDGGYEAPGEEREANGHLLAAAPDLYEAATTALIELEAWDNGPDSLDPGNVAIGLLRAALAKAAGSSDA